MRQSIYRKEAVLELKFNESGDNNDEDTYTIECIIARVYLDDEDEMNKGCESEEEDPELEMMKEMGLPTSFVSGQKKVQGLDKTNYYQENNRDRDRIKKKNRVEDTQEKGEEMELEEEDSDNKEIDLPTAVGPVEFIPEDCNEVNHIMNNSTTADFEENGVEDVKENVEEDQLEEEFQVYWSENGPNIIKESWEESYKDYLPENSNESPEAEEKIPYSTNEGNETCTEDESYNQWSVLWIEHNTQTYEKTKERFIKERRTNPHVAFEAIKTQSDCGKASLDEGDGALSTMSPIEEVEKQEENCAGPSKRSIDSSSILNLMGFDRKNKKKRSKVRRNHTQPSDQLIKADKLKLEPTNKLPLDDRNESIEEVETLSNSDKLQANLENSVDIDEMSHEEISDAIVKQLLTEMNSEVEKEENDNAPLTQEEKEQMLNCEISEEDYEKLCEELKYVPSRKSKNSKRKKIKYKTGPEGMEQAYKLASSLDLAYENSDGPDCKIRVTEGQIKYCRKAVRTHIRYKDEDTESSAEQPLSNGNHDHLPQLSKNGIPMRYWAQRYRLFSKFDEGIQMDEESWYSVTPEKIAQHIAKQFQTYPKTPIDVIIDAFCGAGGNTIQLAKHCQKVIAIDVDPDKIKMAKNNATIYGVDHLIDFVIGDYMTLASSLRADAVFLSPPWGGPDYINNAVFDITTMPIDGFRIMAVTVENITQNVAYYLPRNTDLNQMNRLAKDAGKRVRIEQNLLNRKCKTVTAYYGVLVGESKSE